MPEKVQVALVPVEPQQVAELIHLTDFEIPVVVDLITQGGAADAQPSVMRLHFMQERSSMVSVIKNASFWFRILDAMHNLWLYYSEKLI